MSKILGSSARSDWQTPPYVLRLVRKVGPIWLDPATTGKNPTRAKHTITQTKSSCGLSLDWHPHFVGAPPDALCFCNPPFGVQLGGPIDPTRQRFAKVKGKGRLVGRGFGWAEKMSLLNRQGIYLLPAAVETVWFATLLKWCDRWLVWNSPTFGSRLQFNLPTGEAVNGNTKGSVLFYRGASPDRFAEVFGPHGHVFGRPM